MSDIGKTLYLYWIVIILISSDISFWIYLHEIFVVMPASRDAATSSALGSVIYDILVRLLL